MLECAHTNNGTRVCPCVRVLLAGEFLLSAQIAADGEDRTVECNRTITKANALSCKVCIDPQSRAPRFVYPRREMSACSQSPSTASSAAEDLCSTNFVSSSGQEVTSPLPAMLGLMGGRWWRGGSRKRGNAWIDGRSLVAGRVAQAGD